MSDEGRRQPVDSEEELSRLIREAGRINDSSFKRPSDNTVSAYLLGGANGAQRDEMRAALFSSSNFRREIAQLTEELDQLPEGQFNSLATPGAALERAAVEPGRQVSESIVERIAGLLRRLLVPSSMPQWAMAGAAAMVVVAISLVYVMRGDRYVTVEPGLVSAAVEMELLLGTNTRSTDPARPTGFPRPEAAAMDAFRSVLEYHKGQFSVLSLRREDRAGDGLAVAVQISDGDLIKQIYRAILNSTPESAPTNFEAWILTLPNRTLYRLPITGNAAGVKLASAHDQQFVVAITWRISDLYYSTIASTK